MKTLFRLLCFFMPFAASAQNVGINNDGSAPDASAILDIKSTTRGLLIPRMNTAQRLAISPPATGLTVFDLDTYSFWMYRGDVNGGWAEIQHQFQNYWLVNGAHTYNSNTGNVGIGTNNPQEKLTINAANAAIQFMNSGTARGYLQVSGADMKLGTYANNTTGNIIFNTKAVDRMRIDENGLVGIGTASPTALLTLNGTNPGLQLQNAGADRGFVELASNDLLVGTNSTNTTGNLVFQTRALNRMIIDESGRVSIGTSSLANALSLNGTNPTFQLKNGDVDKGFIQISGNDIKMGTNIGNSLGRFVVRTNGGDRFFVDSLGRVGIGAPAPTAELVINKNGSGLQEPAMEFRSNNTLIGAVKLENNILSQPDMVIQNETANGRTLVSAVNNTYAVVVHPNSGGVSIGGDEKASGYKLAVNGQIICTNLTMQAINNWPDYVFADDYTLMPLAEVKQFITANKHLPNIPSAAQIEKDGIQMQNITKALMEKVEELTLYILQQQEQIDTLKKQLPAAR